MDDVDGLGARLDKAMATLVVSTQGERHLIAESALVAVALYLLNKYADGFLKGLGFEDLAARHGRKTGEFLRQLRAGPDAAAMAAARDDLDEALVVLRAHAQNEPARAAALEAVVLAYLDAGAVRPQAQREAAKVAATGHRLLGS